jgi:AraC-like DNA-binding protein
MSLTAEAAPYPVGQWMKSCSGLVARHEHVVAHDVRTTRQRILDGTNGRCSFTTLGQGRFAGFSEARARVGRIGVRFLEWDCESECEATAIRGEDHDLVLHLPLKGEFVSTDGRNSVAVSPGQVVLLTASGAVHRRWHGPNSMLSFAIERSLFRAVVGGGSNAALDRLQMQVIDLARAATLARVIDAILADLNAETPTLADPAIRRDFESLLARLILQSAARAAGMSAKLVDARLAMPAYVTNAEQYLRDNLARPIDIRALAEAAGVPVRTLYYGFGKHLGATPLQHLKALRLDEARRVLETSQPRAGLVTQVAKRVGYLSKSRFSSDFKRRFGETATAVLARRD